MSWRERSWPQFKLTLPLLQVSLPCVLEGEFLALSRADPPLLQVPLRTSCKNLDSTSTHPCRSAEANIVKSPRVEEQQFPAKASFSYRPRLCGQRNGDKFKSTGGSECCSRDAPGMPGLGCSIPNTWTEFG